MKNRIFHSLPIILLAIFSLSTLNVAAHIKAPCGDYGDFQKPKVQVAILLDTSGSMSGLIDQARQQVWTMVSELATTKYNGLSPTFELGLYEYGKDELAARSNWVRRILPLTSDLDAISEQLFALKTNGGQEYCGAVIKQSLEGLNWSSNPNDLKIIFIAGNEEFTQGPIDYQTSCKSAIEKSIIVNTIFCGNEKQGIQTKWKDGADLADGKFLTINHNATIAHIDAPQDKRIQELNQKLNETYIGYGEQGADKIARQKREDANAMTYSITISNDRAVAKSSQNYNNADWDLVDAFEDDSEILEEISEEELPEELQDKTVEERKEFVSEKKEEREKINAEIQELASDRKTYLANERSKQNAENTLNNVILETIREQANSKNYCFDQ